MRLDLSINNNYNNNSKTARRSTHIFICAAFMLLGSSLYYLDFSIEYWFQELQPKGSEVIFVKRPEQLVEEQTPGDFLVDTPGCHIPAFDPFDPIVKKFIVRVKPIGCERHHAVQLVNSNLSALFVVPDVLPVYNVTDIDQLECCYRPFWRVEGDISNYTHGVDDRIQHAKNCTPFQNEVRLNEEFVEVMCQINGTCIYHDYHAFTPLKDDVEDRCETTRNTIGEDLDDALSVLVIGIDAVSRINFHRQMPLTDAYLREMGGIEMLGYNKVADNTFPNLVAVLSGLTEEELQKTCWPTSKTSFDSCPWLWNNFRDAGYRTAFGEDAPWMGVFSFVKVGFVRQPTDYYMRPYSKIYEDKAGHSKKMNAKLCIGSRLTAEVLLQYASKFSMTMASKRSFGLFWGASLSHDFLNYPQLGDSLHRNVIRDLVASGALNRTLLIVMSDHGIRWGSIRETYQGRLEERLPLLYFVFPPWFKENYSAAVANLRRNVHRLTSPFDLHETLLDLLDLQSLQRESLRSRAINLDWKRPPRGVSLFDPINKNRTCETAGILPHWCTCQQSETLPLGSLVVAQVAHFVVEFLNSLLQPYRECSKLVLSSVHSASVQYPLDHLSNNTKGGVQRDYVLVIQTTPGDGVFEGTVRERQKKLTVTGTVSRLNTYGNQSACVMDYHMKLYCYCGFLYQPKLWRN